MNAYETLAHSYDRFTQDVGYDCWADWLERHFAKSKIPINLVLDLACGTGSLTFELAKRGYEMIGVDISGEMLMEAVEKCAVLPDEARPVFLCQSMDELDLFGSIDACVCCLDSINYVTDKTMLQEAFRRIHAFLAPGGVFIFDINTPEKLQAMDGCTFLDETEDVYCVWRADYDKRSRICSYGFDLFERDGDKWIRESEVHEEKAWTTDELAMWLKKVGFSRVRIFGDKKMRAPKEGEQRVFIVAEKEEQTADEFAAAFAKEYHRWEKSSES